MATVTRQPFAPLDGARLQSLTSMKNRQNSVTASASPVGKRKASDLIEADDFENVDPIMFSKRSKGASGNASTKELFKPSSIVMTKATSMSMPTTPFASSIKPISSSVQRSRALLQPKSVAAKLNPIVTKPSPLSAPAGRSPTRGKRSGILSSRRRTSGPYTRVDPPMFNLSSGNTPFSLDAALKGTIPSYAARNAAAPVEVADSFSALETPDMKASWFFDIHEDTPEQEMTNLLQHGTCVLDISSDEESEQKATRERAEGRDKENIPPADDVSQTSARRAARRVSEDEMVVEKQRLALSEMNAEDFYEVGCDQSTIIIIPGDEDETELPKAATSSSFEFAPEISLEPLEPVMPLEAMEQSKTVDDLINSESSGGKAAVLEPMEGTGESFELWESGSAKDEAETSIEVTSQ